MRLTLQNFCRACPELNHLSDEECERFLFRVLTQREPPLWIAYVVFLAVAGAWMWLAVDAAARMNVSWDLADDHVERTALLYLCGPALATLFGCLAGLVARDRILIRALLRERDCARCPRCDQSLHGLPISGINVDSSHTGDAKVRCPECGTDINLLEHGLSTYDLVPFDQRVISRDAGSLRPIGRMWQWRAKGRTPSTDPGDR